MNKVLSDERLGAKLRVIENRCVLFNSLTYVYIYIYIYMCVCVCVFLFFFNKRKKTAWSAISNLTQNYVVWSTHFQGVLELPLSLVSTRVTKF